jgi:hypothetical protein
MNADVLADLRQLTHLAKVLNSRQHAGLEITPAMWGELYQLTNHCEATIQAADAQAAAASGPDLIIGKRID